MTAATNTSISTDSPIGETGYEPLAIDFRAIVCATGIGFTLVDTGTGRIEYANPAFCRMIGYSLEELLSSGMTFIELTHPDDVGHNVDLHKRFISGDLATYTIEKRYLRKDRSVFWGRTTASAASRGADGRAIKTLGSIQDVSDIKYATDQLSAAARMAGVATWFVDFTSGNATCSAGYNEIYGLPFAEPAPSFEEFLSRVHPDDLLRVKADVQGAWKGSVLTCEHRIVRPSGEVCWLTSMLKRIVNSSFQIVGVLGTCVDNTEFQLRREADRDPVSKMMNYVENNSDKNLSISSLAAAAGVSPRTLFRLCRQELEITPAEYARNARLRHARELFQQASDSTTVTQVALKFNFANVSHFAKYYEAAFGELPSETLTRAKATA